MHYSEKGCIIYDNRISYKICAIILNPITNIISWIYSDKLYCGRVLEVIMYLLLS